MKKTAAFTGAGNAKRVASAMGRIRSLGSGGSFGWKADIENRRR
jgi:hypothetical protein